MELSYHGRVTPLVPTIAGPPEQQRVQPPLDRLPPQAVRAEGHDRAPEGEPLPALLRDHQKGQALPERAAHAAGQGESSPQSPEVGLSEISLQMFKPVR